MPPTLGARTMVDAGRADPGPDGQRRNGVACFVPGSANGCSPGRAEAGVAAAVVALPDPAIMHNRLVVVSDEFAEVGLDRGDGAQLRGRQLMHGSSHSARRRWQPTAVYALAVATRPRRALARPPDAGWAPPPLLRRGTFLSSP